MVPFAVYDPLRDAERFEFSGNVSYAIECYKQIVLTHSDEDYRIWALKSLMRAMNKQGDDFSEIRYIISNEIYSGNYKRNDVLDFLLCELILKEGLKEDDESLSKSKYIEAVDAFMVSARKYKGTEMEVEMFARIANIYGDFLNDSEKAKEYADKAATVNPGQPILLSAYGSAAIEYDPWKYENKYDSDTGQNEPIPEEDRATTTGEEFVSIETNPFNPSTSIIYSIKEPSQVKLEVFSITGQKVTTLANGYMSAGAHSVKFDGSNLASGFYFFRLESKGFNKSGKMLLVK